MKNAIHLKTVGAVFLLLLGACAAPEETPSAADLQPSSLPEPDPDDGGLVLPSGFRALVLADGLGNARHIAVRDNGDVYVAIRRPEDGRGIAALRDTTGDGRADRIERFGEAGGTGIGIHEGYLYFGSDTSVFRYPLPHQDELVPHTAPEVIVEGLPEQSEHAAKPFTFDAAGNLYLDVGAPSNSCQQQNRTAGSPGQDPCPQLERHAGIWRFEAGRPGQTQLGDGYHYATGIRHAVALQWNREVGDLYVVQHGRDQLSQLWPDLFTAEQNAELPAEEFLRVTEGSNFGWPYCYWDQIQEKRVLAPEYGGDGRSTERCEQFGRPILAFPGHWAPNDLLFYTGRQFPERYRNGALIAFHGSWNRAPLEQQGYFVAFVPFQGAQPSGGWERFADGFAGVETIRNPGNAEHRPMGLAVGSDGSLYITDSVKGRIWRVFYTGSEDQPGR